jgi:hypothetical protein
MTDQSHRDEMNAAIRAQRERHAVPRSIAGAEGPPAPQQEQEHETAPEQEPAGRKGFFARLLGR